jgi:hypothetical protein
MLDWIKAQGSELAELARRPGAGMAVLGFLLAQMSLQADLYVPEVIARSALAVAAFWLGQVMIVAGAAWFVLPEVKRMMAPPRVRPARTTDDRAPAATPAELG